MAIAIALLLVALRPAGAQVRTEDDRKREAAVAEFTLKTKAANYPALFEQAAAEFNVPADVLKGVAFAETRWEHLRWPPGENYSPDNGMPRPYGIMSLWSNEFFGLSLVQAAELIGKDEEELKADPFLNIRGAAALLRKKYDENPKPAGTTGPDVESWRYAIAEYSGIPQRDLKHRHALEVFEFMNQGYHQFGIEWNARAVKLEPMRAEVAGILAEEKQKREELAKAQIGTTELGFIVTTNAPSPAVKPVWSLPRKSAGAALTTPPTSAPTAKAEPARNGLWWPMGVLAALLTGSLLVLRRQAKYPPNDEME